MDKTLEITVKADGLTARGDTYGAKESLKSTGWSAHKVGYDWEWTIYVDTPQAARAALEALADALAKENAALKRHLADATTHGFTARPLEYAWHVVLYVGPNKAHYVVTDGGLMQAQMVSGQPQPIAA